MPSRLAISLRSQSSHENEGPPKLEDMTLNETFKVSLTGTAHDGAIGDLRLVDVQIDK